LIRGDHERRGDADRVLMGVLGKDASALECLTTATRVACFRVKLNQSASAHVAKNYDLVAFFDCLHEMGDPVGAGKHVKETLAKDGSWMIVELLMTISRTI
jgi:hypothetical protein